MFFTSVTTFISLKHRFKKSAHPKEHNLKWSMFCGFFKVIKAQENWKNDYTCSLWGDIKPTISTDGLLYTEDNHFLENIKMYALLLSPKKCFLSKKYINNIGDYFKKEYSSMLAFW